MMLASRKFFNLRKIFAVPKDFLKLKIYCTEKDTTFEGVVFMG